jgi:hypothetical protein
VSSTAWTAGVAAVYGAAVLQRPAPAFVCAAIDGWVLVPLGFPLNDPDEFDLGALSRRFGEVQRFFTHRVSEVHEWERWVDGQPLRRYGWAGGSGEVSFDEGEPSELDEDLMPAGSTDWDAWEFADEERVMEIAAAWSVDPSRLDERTDVEPAGLLGWR